MYVHVLCIKRDLIIFLGLGGLAPNFGMPNIILQVFATNIHMSKQYPLDISGELCPPSKYMQDYADLRGAVVTLGNHVHMPKSLTPWDKFPMR